VEQLDTVKKNALSSHNLCAEVNVGLRTWIIQLDRWNEPARGIKRTARKNGALIN